MTTILFNALGEQARTHLIAAFNGREGLGPIMAKVGSKKRSVGGWGFLALLMIGVYGVLLYADYGHYAMPRQGAAYLIAHMICLYLIGWSLLRAVHNFMLNRSEHYLPGVYVFPSDMIVADGAELQVYPLNEMQDLRIRPLQGFFDAELVFPERTERFVVAGQLGQQQLMELQQAWEAALAGAMQSDLFAGLRGTPQWTDRAAQEQAAQSATGVKVGLVPKLLARPALVALAFIVVAPPVWLVRNHLSDKAAYARTERYNEVWTAELYIRGNGHYEEKARSVLLPRAAFTEARETGEPVKLQEFWTTYPQAPQVQQAKTEAYQIAFSRAQSKNTSAAYGAFVSQWPEAPQLEQARTLHRDLAFAEAQNNVTALRSFIQSFPQAPQVEQARGQIAARYRQVKGQFESQAGRDRSMRRFMDGLIEWLEENESSEVQVRFHAPSASQLQAVDAGVSVGGSATAMVAPIAPHFTSERCVSRESAITRSLSSAFAAVFPPDVMQLRHVGRVSEEAAEQPIAVPTIDVYYTISASGTMYQSSTDPRVYVGINVNFRIEMQVPDGEEHSTRVSVRPPRTFSVSTFGGVSSDSNIYSTMADRAFERLSDELRRHFFRPGTAAYNAARPRS